MPKDSQQPNPELLQGASYRLPHMRPGEQPLRRNAVLCWQWPPSLADRRTTETEQAAHSSPAIRDR